MTAGPLKIASFEVKVSGEAVADPRDRFNLIHTARIARGRHSPALQVPCLFVDEVRTFFRDYRER